MKLIILSAERIIPQEAEIINMLFDEGMSVFHLRKPFATKQQIQNLLNGISPLYHNRVVLHDYFELAFLYNIKGIHLNTRNNAVPENIGSISISRSCHSFPEIEKISRYDYVFLSPLFDSISKTGYEKAFTGEQLEKACREGIINKKVIALGGICMENISVVSGYGFGGVAILGTLWKAFSQDRDINTLLQRFNKLKTICNKL